LIRLKHNDLINILNRLFKPIAPSIIIAKSDNDIKFDINSLPKNYKHYKIIAWQYEGIDLVMIKRDIIQMNIKL